MAQTPPGFAPSVETKLEVIFGSKAVTTPGESFTKTGKNSMLDISYVKYLD